MAKKQNIIQDTFNAVDQIPTQIAGGINSLMGNTNNSQLQQLQQQQQMQQQQPPMQQLPPAEIVPPKVNPTQPQVIRDAQGNISGVDMGGRVILGMPKDINALIQNDLANKTAPNGSVEASAISQQQTKQEQIAQSAGMAGQVGQMPTPQPQPLTNLNYGEAAQAGIGGVLPGLMGGAATGAAAGLVGSAGALSIPGAIVGGLAGAVTGFLISARSDLKTQLEGQKSAEVQTFPTAQKNLRLLVTDTNQNPNHAAENLQMFNQQLAIIQQQHSKLKRETQRDINAFISDGNTADLQKFENFDSPGGSREYLIRNMQEALINPNPSKVMLTAEDLTA